MPRASKPKPSYTVASAMALLTSELARLDAIDRGESTPEALELARIELAEAKRDREAALRERDAANLAHNAISESRVNMATQGSHVANAIALAHREASSAAELLARIVAPLAPAVDAAIGGGK